MSKYKNRQIRNEGFKKKAKSLTGLPIEFTKNKALTPIGLTA